MIRKLSAKLYLAAITALGVIGTSQPAIAQDDSPPTRQTVKMDSARALKLYVSDRHEDHPQANYAAQLKAKQRTDSIFAARSAGVMKFSKVKYKSSADGLEIPAYLFEPLGASAPRSRAAMVWVHGGVHGNMDQNYLPFIKEAVKRGYIIITPDYRGSTGHGESFHNLIDYGGYEVDDVQSAATFLNTLPAVDPERLGVMGWSHGGYITTLLLTRHATGSPFKAGAAIVPVTNLLFRLSFKGPSYQRSFSTQSRLQGLPFENRDEYVRRSPYYHVDSLKVPLLVHVATNDEDVNFEESRPLIDAFIARKPGLAETKIYIDPTPGPASKGHTFSRRVNRQTLELDDSPEQIDSWSRVWALFDRTIGNK